MFCLGSYSHPETAEVDLGDAFLRTGEVQELQREDLGFIWEGHRTALPSSSHIKVKKKVNK